MQRVIAVSYKISLITVFSKIFSNINITYFCVSCQLFVVFIYFVESVNAISSRKLIAWINKLTPYNLRSLYFLVDN